MPAILHVRHQAGFTLVEILIVVVILALGIGANAVMLSDRDLSVTRQFDIENVNTSVKPPGLVGLPIPTTVLTDAEGIVRWIDQADDYRNHVTLTIAQLEADMFQTLEHGD